MAIADGPTEVHKVTVAREVLKGVTRPRPATPGPASTWSSGGAAARAEHADLLELEVGNL